MDARNQGQSVTRYRRFGPVGPVYEIIGVARDLEDGDQLLKVRVVDSGEEAEYRRSRALEDPEVD